MTTIEHMVSASHLSAVETLGTRLEHAFTAEEAMEQAKLGGWDVRKWPAYAVDPETGKKYRREGMNDVVRTNPDTGKPQVLGKYPVSDGFSIVQNEDHAAFLNTLVEESGAHFELAFALDGGNKVALSMKMPGHILIGGVDPIDLSLLALNAHDGSMSFTIIPTPIRYACGNVLNSAFKNNSGLVRIRHSSGAQKQMVAQARETLDLTFKYLDGFQEEAERMIQTTMTQAQFEAIIEREFGAPDDASSAAVTRAEKKLAEMTELFAEAQAQEGIRDTAWAGYNALTEWADHYSPTRGDDKENSRAAKAILDPSFKNDARRLILAEVR